MAKIRIDLPPNPEDWQFLCTEHQERPDQPFPQYHTVWVWTLDEMQTHVENPGWILWMPPPITGPPPLSTVWNSAWDLARHLAANPEMICDRCIWCHYAEFRGFYPRWNLCRGESYPYRVPACLSNDHLWHYT